MQGCKEEGVNIISAQSQDDQIHLHKARSPKEVMNTGTRPKVTEYQNCIFISIKMLQQNPETDLISVENLCIIITKSVLISFQEKKGVH